MSIALYLFFGLFLAVGAAILAFGVRSLLKSRAVEHWPVAHGELLERKLAADSDSDGTTYQVQVHYAYSVAGRPYEGKRLAFGYGGSSGRAMHQKILDKLLQAHSVEVRYNPQSPEESALSWGVNRSIVFVLIFGSVWTMFTLGLFALFLLEGKPDHVMLEHLVVH